MADRDPRMHIMADLRSEKLILHLILQCARVYTVYRKCCLAPSEPGSIVKGKHTKNKEQTTKRQVKEKSHLAERDLFFFTCTM